MKTQTFIRRSIITILTCLTLIQCKKDEPIPQEPTPTPDSKPQIAIDHESYDFGEVPRLTTVSQAFSISNTGNANLQVTKFTFTGDNATEFSTDAVATTVAVGSTYSFTISLTPKTYGSKTASLQIDSNAGQKSLSLTSKVYYIPPKITFTTSKAVGESITLTIDADEADRPDVWIDLNNNGTKEDGEKITVFGSKKTYALQSQQLSVHGKVAYLKCSSNLLTALDVSQNAALTYLDCTFNQLTALDVSQNTALYSLWCDSNQIKATNMTALVNSLPDRTGKTTGILYPKITNGGNEFNDTHKAITEGKNWKIGY